MKSTGKFRTGSVLAISFAHLVHDVYSSFLAPLLPLLIEKFSIGYTVAGLFSILQRLPSLLNPLFGVIAERLSPRRLLVGATLVTTISMSLLGASPGALALSGLLLVMGVSASVFHVPAPVMIRRASGIYMGRGMSFYMLGGELARTLGPLAILAAVSAWSLEGTWRLIPFGFFMAFLLDRGLRHIEDGPRGGIPEQGERGERNRATKFFALVGGYLFFRAGMKAALTIFLPVIMIGRGLSLWEAGISLSLLQLAGALGTFFWGTFSDRLGRRTTLLLVGAISPLLMLGFTVAAGGWTWVLLVALGFTLFAQGPVLLALVQDVGGRRPAFFNGIYMTVNFVINSLAVLLLGIGGDLMGMGTTVAIAAILGFASVVFALGLKNGVVEGI